MENKERPSAWERRYDLELALRKHRLLILSVIIVIIVMICVCTIPIVENVDLTLFGYEIHMADETDADGNFTKAVPDPDAEPVFTTPRTLELKGKLYRYLIKQDYYVGEINIDGFFPEPAVNREKLTREEKFLYYNEFRFTLNEPDRQWLNGKMQTVLRRDENRDAANIIFVPGGLDTMIFQIMVSTSPTARTSAEQYLVFPAESPEDAAEKYREIVFGDISFEAENTKVIY